MSATAPPESAREQTDASWENDPLFQVVRGHLTLALAVLVGASTLLAVLLGARFSTTVAIALLSIAGPTSIISRLLLPAFPVVLFAAVTVSSFWVIEQRSRGRPIAFSLAVITVAAVVSVLVLPPYAFIAFGVIVLVLLGVRRRFSLLRGRPNWTLLTPVFFAVGLWTYLYSGGMWLPPERLQLTDGTTVVAYVLRESGQWVAVLRDEDRQILFLRPADITAREICRPYARLEQTIPQMLIGVQPPQPPLCRANGRRAAFLEGAEARVAGRRGLAADGRRARAGHEKAIQPLDRRESKR